jgi:methyl-accepting chemotaxis protein
MTIETSVIYKPNATTRAKVQYVIKPEKETTMQKTALALAQERLHTLSQGKYQWHLWVGPIEDNTLTVTYTGNDEPQSVFADINEIVESAERTSRQFCAMADVHLASHDRHVEGLANLEGQMASLEKLAEDIAGQVHLLSAAFDAHVSHNGHKRATEIHVVRE